VCTREERLGTYDKKRANTATISMWRETEREFIKVQELGKIEIETVISKPMTRVYKSTKKRAIPRNKRVKPREREFVESV